MATATNHLYYRTCDKCNGDFIVGWRKNKEVLFGLIGTPNSPIYCEHCIFGKQYAKEVVLQTGSISPILIY